MYQVFDEASAPAASGDRVTALLRELKRRRLKGFLVPHSDQHQNEFLPPSEERLAWLTGFTGSAGVAIVTDSGSALFVDGRYILQAPKQVDTDLFEVLQIPKAKPSEWLKSTLVKGNAVGYDPRLHTISEIERLTKTLDAAGIRLTPVNENPIDKIWGKERPAPPRAEIFAQPLELAGKSPGEKLMQVQMDLVDAEHDAVLLTAPDSLCWLFNYRGGDIKHTPVALAYAIVPAKGRPTLFIDPEKVGEPMRIALKPFTEIAAPDQLDEALTELAKTGAKIRLDTGSASMRFANVIKAAGGKHVAGDDPCTLPKAIKTDAEQEGTRNAHVRDGVAMARFLAWLDEVAETGRVDEVSAAIKLEDFRRESGQLKDISFDTIAASGPHGAVVHYRPTNDAKRVLDKNSLFLIDSGGQYVDGTTDVTRTIGVGKPTAEMKRHYGLVLRCHIAIAAARFPEGSRGQDLDPFARGPLWAAGLDFDHGTGHGVGSYLSVHEGPQRLSRLGTEELEPGMILSNEPGFYRKDEYGIRLENLVLVKPAEDIEGGERKMLSFETLTIVPFDRRLIDPKQLMPWELAWLNDYHARVRETIEPLIASEDRPWLRHATAPIG
ncbi:MAG: aminopeptidase P family protein [Pseudomonadota bacterium]